MKNKSLKKRKMGRSIVAILLCVVITTTSMTSVFGVTSDFTTSNENNLEITVESTDEKIQITYHFSDFIMEKVKINGNDYHRIVLDDESNILLTGMPDLPNIRRSIIIPDELKTGVQVISADYQEYLNILIAPTKGVLSRTVNPKNIPYEFDDVYTKDEWLPGVIAELNDPYIIRDFRGQVIQVNPFQYNPLTKKLRVYTDITVEVSPIGFGEINVYNRIKPLTSITSDFRLIYERHFVNFDPVTVNMNPYTPIGEIGNMLVICYDNFYSAIEPFVEWKNMKGIPTELVNLSEIGSSSTDIYNYIENYYNTDGLTFVLLVGDAAQVPPKYIGGTASDPSYSYIVGNDHYPDLFVGRFSAENSAQVETQVERSVEYEKYPQSSTDWYHKGTGIASNQGPGDDGEDDWEHMRNIRSDLIAYTFTDVDELYDGSHGGEDADGNPTSSMVSNAVNDGRSVINYCGHGSTTSWSTTGFSNSGVNALTNDNMLPTIVSVACLNGNFVSGTCFAEAWLRATHNGEPTGAIATFMSTISQSWNPPMDAQDEIVDILVESYSNNKKHTFGALCAHGCMHMNDEYGSSGIGETDAWTVFGDPSLQVRTDTPVTMSVGHNDFMTLGDTTFDVTVTGIENALCAISRNGKLLGYAYTNANGQTTIQFTDPIEAGTVDFVVTAYNKIPYITTIEVLSVDFTWSPEYPNTNSPVYFEDLSQVTVVDRDWDFGDGEHSTDENPIHTYENEGIYLVTLTITDNQNEVYSVSKEIEIKDNWEPVAIAYPETYAGNIPTHSFDGSDSWDPDGTIVSYHWDFDDGYTSDQVNPVHTFNADGIYNVTLTVTDDYGDNDVDTCDIKIDAYTPPVTTIEFMGTLGNNGWYRDQLVGVKLTATDWSGVDYTKYKVGSASWKKYNYPFNIWNDGIHNIQFYSVDIYGNVEDTKSEELKKDMEVPTLNVDLTGEQSGEWYVSPVTVTCSGSDDLSGLDKIMYKVDGTRWIKYASPFMITGDGVHVLICYSQDIAGNTWGNHESIDIPIDIDPPITTYELSGDLQPDGWYAGNVSVSLLAIDNVSGVDYTYYKINEEEWQEYTEPFIMVNRGKHVIEYYSVDNLDRTEQTKSMSIQIGAPPNLPTIVGPTTGKPKTGYTYTINTTHPEGIDVWYLIDWGDGTDTGWIGPYTSGEAITQSHSWTEQGNYTIKVKAKDAFDSESDWATLPITMPKNRQSINPAFLQFLEKLVEQFPILQKLLHIVSNLLNYLIFKS